MRLAVVGDDEVTRLAREVEAMVDRLARTEAARNDLVAAVSHDLRTPITSLRLLVEALDDQVVDERERAAYLSKLRTHVAALAALIDDLFELSRLQAGDLRWSMARVALSELVGETVEAMRREDVAQLVVDVPGDLSLARAAPEQIQRVLFNLIQNAIRHTPADGSVTVRAAAADGGVQVEVADTGSGVADADHERVFEAFFQGGSSARGNGGAGLGLAISRAIVERMAGRSGWSRRRPGRACVSRSRAADDPRDGRRRLHRLARRRPPRRAGRRRAGSSTHCIPGAHRKPEYLNPGATTSTATSGRGQRRPPLDDVDAVSHQAAMVGLGADVGDVATTSATTTWGQPSSSMRSAASGTPARAGDEHGRVRRRPLPLP